MGNQGEQGYGMASYSTARLFLPKGRTWYFLLLGCMMDCPACPGPSEWLQDPLEYQSWSHVFEIPSTWEGVWTHSFYPCFGARRAKGFPHQSKVTPKINVTLPACYASTPSWVIKDTGTRWFGYSFFFIFFNKTTCPIPNKSPVPEQSQLQSIVRKKTFLCKQISQGGWEKLCPWGCAEEVQGFGGRQKGSQGRVVWDLPHRGRWNSEGNLWVKTMSRDQTRGMREAGGTPAALTSQP